MSRYQGRFTGSEEWISAPGATAKEAALHLARLNGGTTGGGRINRKERVRALSARCYAVRLVGRTGEVVLDIRDAGAAPTT